MRIAWLGNLANVGFNYVRLLNAKGLEAGLYMAASKLRVLYPGNPENEYVGASQEPFIHYHRRDYVNYLLNRIGLPGLLRRYEMQIGNDWHVVQAQSCSEIAALRIHRRFRRPFLGMATGADLSEVAVANTPFARLYRRALRSATHLFLTNINQFDLISRLGLEQQSVSFLPFAIDMGRIPSTPQIRRDRMVFYSIARLDWTSSSRFSVKRNDIFLMGFARYLIDPEALPCELWISDWGVDREPTRRLVEVLGIGSSIRWVPASQKGGFYHNLTQCNVAVDQFSMGTVGLAALEAMAAGRPVFAYCGRENARRAYGVDIPVTNCANPEEVYQSLKQITWSRIEAQGRGVTEWVSAYHSEGRIYAQLQNAYGLALGDGSALRA